MTGVQQAQGIDNFFDNLFSFFGRKTDFYTMEDKAITTVNQYLTKHIASFKADKAKQVQIEAQRKAASDKAVAERTAREAAQKIAEESKTTEITDEEAALIEAQEAARKANPAAATAVADDAVAATEEVKTEEEKK